MLKVAAGWRGRADDKTGRSARESEVVSGRECA